MLFNRLKAPALQRVTVSRFGGLDRRGRGSEGSFLAMENLCSDGDGAMQVRQRRAVAARLTAPGGITDKETLVWVDGHTLYVGGHATGLVLSEGEKQFVSMGAYLVIFPDKKWINLRNLSQMGDMEHTVTVSNAALQLCRADGSGYGDYTASATAPEEPEEGALWLDTADAPVLRLYSGGAWTELADTCVALRSTGIGAGFAEGDGVEIFGCEEEWLNGLHVLRAVTEDALIVGGCIAGDRTLTAAVTVSRTVPDMDYVTECGNRLWGCKYGVVGGRAVNEIYASKLGDFKNWHCYQGLSTDSYAASRGSDGPFTAAAAYLGSPLFFKERCIERVYPSAGGAHQIVTLECPGVAEGSHRSVCAVDGTLLYLGRGGVYAFDGGLSAPISQLLGRWALENGVAGGWEGKYWLSAADEVGAQHLLVYDLRRGLWHREDDLAAVGFACWDGELYALATDGTLWAIHGNGVEAEGEVWWMAESGDWGLDTAQRKLPLRLQLCLDLGPNARIGAQVSGDGGKTWYDAGYLQAGTEGLQAVYWPLRQRRSGHVRLRLTGRGDCTLYSVSAVYERGSDAP